jgi:hypothetical protein
MSSAVPNTPLQRDSDDADRTLCPRQAEFIDSDHPQVRARAAQVVGSVAGRS